MTTSGKPADVEGSQGGHADAFGCDSRARALTHETG